MSGKTYPVAPGWKQRAYIDKAKYRNSTLGRSPIQNPSGPSRHAASIGSNPSRRVKNTSFGPDFVSIKWFEDGTTNVAQNCIDRHLPRLANHTAIIWEGDDPKELKHITYQDLHDEVCRLANVLKSHGVKKGDTVTIYLPMIPEAAYAMLACARIGAIHSVVSAVSPPESLAGRIEDCRSKLLITADEGRRGGRKTPLKAHADEAVKKTAGIVETMLVVKHTGGAVGWVEGRDVWCHDAMARAAPECPCAGMHAEDPLFILYTSGSTGAPKGVVHTTAGYLVFAAMTHHYVFDYHEGDIYWCTADVGWVTGHSYIVYGPLANGGTTLMFEGIQPTRPVALLGSCRQASGQYFLYRADRDPRPDARRRRPGQGNEPRLVAASRHGRRADQSRSLGMVLPCRRRSALPDRRHLVADRNRRYSHFASARRDGPKPGLAARPFRNRRKWSMPPETSSKALFGQSGSGRFLAGRCARFMATTSALCGLIFPPIRQIFYRRRLPPDAEGYYWITGRVDDVINVSGHRLGTAEVESSLVAHEKVAEAAVVAIRTISRARASMPLSR